MVDLVRIRREITMLQTFGCLTEAVGEWALETFGGPERIVPCAIHMQREAKEVYDSAQLLQRVAEYNKETVKRQLAGECADLVILAMGMAAHAGFDLEAAFRKKMLENLDRKWSVPDHDGVIEHVRS